MSSFLSTDSPAMQFMDKLKDLILLNLIWILFIIPVVTIGPANTALYSVARKLARGDSPKVWSAFLKEFKECFRKSFLMSLCLLPPVVLIVVYLFMVLSGSSEGTFLLTVLSGIAALILGFICSYAYPLSAYFENTVGQTIKNAMLLPLVNPFLAIVVTLLNLIPLLIFMFDIAVFLRICIFWILLGVALTAFINCRLLAPFFSRFIPEDDEEDEVKL